MTERALPALDLTKAQLLFSKQSSGLYLPVWAQGTDDGAALVSRPEDLPETRTFKTYSTAAGTGEITNSVTRLSIPTGATSLTVKYRDVSSATGVTITVVLNADDDTDEDGKGSAKEGLRVALGEQASVRFPSGSPLTRIGLISDAAETGDSAVELSWGIPA